MSSQLEHKFVQEAEVTAIEEAVAVLNLADGQSLRWPKTLLPEGVKKGDRVRVLIHDKKTEEAERRALAHALLNELLDVTK